MRCLIVIPSLTRAGAETQAVDLANGLARYGHSVHLLAFERNIEQVNRLSGVTFHHANRKSKYDLSFVTEIAKVISSQRITVVLGVLLIGAMVSLIAARKSTTKPSVVAAIHTTKSRGLKQELQIRLIYRYVLRRLSALIFVCHQQRQYWIRRFPELDRIAHVVYNGVETERLERRDFERAAAKLRQSLGLPDSAFIFTCIAGFRPEKGHVLLLRAFSQLSGEPFLLLAGEGPERKEIERLAQSLGIGARVRFVGNVPDVRPLIVASDSTVLASTAVETFSMAMLESMALGVPMIAPRIAGLPEAITHLDSGLLFPIGDVAALTQEMEFIMRDPPLGRRMGESAARRVRSSFTHEQMLRGTEQILESRTDPTNNVDSHAIV
jgi:glycosyltransferase involved in cell wall biosynthesis